MASLAGLELTDSDILSAFKTKNKNKIVVKFTAMGRKRELMKKLKSRKTNTSVL